MSWLFGLTWEQQTAMPWPRWQAYRDFAVKVMRGDG